MIIRKEIKISDNLRINVGRDYAVMQYMSRAGIVTETLISLEDVNEVAKYRWSVTTTQQGKSYFKSNKGGYLHRLIMKPDKKLVVDHINGDTFDNRRHNLRILTSTENNMNRLDSTVADIAGITLTYNGKYLVRLRRNKVCLYCETFSTREEAIKARLKVELRYGLYINENLYKVMLTEQELTDSVICFTHNLYTNNVLEKINSGKIINLIQRAA